MMTEVAEAAVVVVAEVMVEARVEEEAPRLLDATTKFA
jgi:hypothetical protein